MFHRNLRGFMNRAIIHVIMLTPTQRRRMEDKICWICGDPLATKWLCRKCADRHNTNLRKTRTRRAANNLCIDCGVPLPDLKYSRCQRCRQLNAQSVKLRAYGLTIETYTQMIEQQENRCAICGKGPKLLLHVDHCHTSGRVRGLLCRYCNTGLGQFYDNPDFLRAAITYLEDAR